MKTLTKIFYSLKKNIEFNSSFSIIVSMVLILFGTWMPGFVTECYAQSPWTQKADMLVPRGWHSSCVLDGKIYAIGGVTRTDAYSTKTVQVYDPILNSWTYRADMANGRASFPTCVVNGKIWAIGGASKLWYGSIKSIEEYNPATNTWTHITDMPRARQGHTASLVDGKIYIIGGGATWEAAIAEVDVYDTLTKIWTTVSPMPTPRMYLTAVVLNDTIYTIGGDEGSKNNQTSVPTVQAYHPATDTWATKADNITPRKYFSASVINDKIYVVGGKKGGHLVYTFTTHVEEYDPKTDTWIEVSELPAKYLRAHAADTLNGKIYVFGGTINNPPVIIYPTTYVYNPRIDLFILINKFEVDKSYVKAGIDSVCISAKISDPTGMTLLAEIEAPDQTPVDSLQLFDDGNHNDGNAGDSLFANVWPVSYAEEQNYYVDLKVTQIDADTVFMRINNVASFTTIGPVTVEYYTCTGSDTIPNPGDNINFQPRLGNNGSTAIATDIRASLSVSDINASLDQFGSRSYGDISPGETSSATGYCKIQISENCPVNTEIPVKIDIYSSDYKYWCDTFSILILPTAVILEDIKEPITRIYPNPVNEILNIGSNIHSQIEIEINTINGQLIHNERFEGTSHQIDLSPLQKGIYLITVRSKDFIETRKLIKMQ